MRSAQGGSRPMSMGTTISYSGLLISGCVRRLPSPLLSCHDTSIAHGSLDTHLVTSRCCVTFGRHGPILTCRRYAVKRSITGRRRLQEGARPHACHDPIHGHHKQAALIVSHWIFGEYKIPDVQAERICPLVSDRCTVDSTSRQRKVALRCGACRPTCRNGGRAAGSLLHCLTSSRAHRSAKHPCEYSPLSVAKNLLL